MRNFRFRILMMFYLLMVFSVFASQASAYSVSVDKTSVIQGNSVTVTWSGFGDTVNVAVYKGSSFWTYANTQGSYAGSQVLATSGWELRSDYKIRVEQKSNTTISMYSSIFSVSVVVPLPPTLFDYSINGGASYTTVQMIYLQNNFLGTAPTHYMASESSNFSGASWNTYNGNPAFALSSGYGLKTVHLKLKNANGESNTKSAVIDYIVATNGYISGNVKDSASGAVIIQANIVLKQNGLLISSTSTASDGTYSLPSLPPGNYSLEIGKTEYSTWAGECIVTAGNQSVKDVTLSLLMLEVTLGGGQLLCP